MSKVRAPKLRYQTRFIPSQVREVRKEFDLTEADYREPKQMYAGTHPERLKIRQYYIDDRSNYTSEERREFLLLAECNEELKWSPGRSLSKWSPPKRSPPTPCDSEDDTASSDKETYDRLHCCIKTWQRTDASYAMHLRKAHVKGLPSTSKYP